jgi:hypothetical protein
MSRRTGIIGGAVGLVLLIAALVWSTVAVPALVKFPLSTNMTLHYTGSLVTFVNAKTGATLATPASAPLTVDRTIRALPGESSSSIALVHERLVVHSPGANAVENNRYAIDRRNMDNVPNAKAYTFAAGNRAASSGTYYVTLPMSLSAKTTTIRIWKPETGTSYPLVPLTAGSEPSSLDGLKVDWFRGTLPMTPVAGYERAALASRGFPMTIPPARVEAQLTAEGVSIAKLSAALLPVLTPAETRQVTTVLSTPVPLRYYAFGTGRLAAEPGTGMLIDLHGITDGIAAAPSTKGIDVLIGVLSKHSSVAGVPAALSALQRLAAAPPQPVYELRYSQTAVSVADSVQTAKNQLGQISAVTLWAPVGAVVLGGVLFLGGLTVVWRRRTPPSAGAGRAAEVGGPAAVPPEVTRPAA